MNCLPEDVIRYLLPYLTEGEKVLMLDCSSFYYHSFMKSVRNAVIWYFGKVKYRLAKVLSLIEDPGKQLEIKIFSENLRDLGYPFVRLSVLDYFNFQALANLFLENNDIKLGKYRMYGLVEQFHQADLDILVRMCEVGAIHNLEIPSFIFNEESLVFPYFPNVNSLKIIGTLRHTVTLPVSYSSHLQKLELIGFLDLDVSSLDHIPDLTFHSCQNMRGISCLKNNRRVGIWNCGIDNAPEMFCNSEEIILFCMESHQTSIDLSQWNKVKRLTLKCSELNSNLLLFNNALPPSVQRCYLSGLFVEQVDWIPFTLQLFELTLSQSNSLQSLIGLGLESIPVLTLDTLRNLTTLQGLGGRNKKVTVRSCQEIKDFSALRSVDTVIIEDCQGFRDISQVNEVRVLRQTAEEHPLIRNPKKCVKPENLGSLGKRIEYLQIFAVHLTSSCYHSLSRISQLELLFPVYEEIALFLTHGGRFENQLISICYNADDRESFDRFYQSHFSSSDYRMHEVYSFDNFGSMVRLIRNAWT